MLLRYNVFVNKNRTFSPIFTINYTIWYTFSKYLFLHQNKYKKYDFSENLSLFIFPHFLGKKIIFFVVSQIPKKEIEECVVIWISFFAIFLVESKFSEKLCWEYFFLFIFSPCRFVIVNLLLAILICFLRNNHFSQNSPINYFFGYTSKYSQNSNLCKIFVLINSIIYLRNNCAYYYKIAHILSNFEQTCT